MKITKQLMTTLTISPQDMYVNDMDRLIIDLLKYKFENKCFQGIFITKILNINRRSALNFTRTDLGAYGNIDCSFNVDAITYSKGDFIHGMEIKKIKKISSSNDTLQFICVKDNIIADVRSEASQSIKEGDKISVTVEATMFSVGKTEISIFANLFNLTYDNFTYKIATVVEDDYLKDLWEEVNKLSTYKHQNYEFFDKLLHGKPTKGLSLDKLPKGSYTRKGCHRSSLICTKSDSDEIVETPQKMMENFLLDYIKAINNIKDMCETYTDIKKYNHIWKLYEDFRNLSNE